MKTVVLDIETTGLPAKGWVYDKDFMTYPYIVTLAYKINADETKYFIINQEGRLIPPEATAIHGITDEMAAASEHKLMDVIGMLIRDAQDVEFAIGHNIYFDTSNIKANILRRAVGEEAIMAFYAEIEKILHKDRRVDTMMRTIKFCDLNGKWPKLVELHEKLFPGEVFNAHNAKDDVEATYKCYLKLKELGVL